MKSKSSMPSERIVSISVQPPNFVSMPNTVQGLAVPSSTETPSVQMTRTMKTSRTYLNFLSKRSNLEPIFGRLSLSFVPRYQKKSPIVPKAHKNPQKKRPMIAVMINILAVSTICPVSAGPLKEPVMSAT